MKNYYRIILGPKSVYAQKCFEKGFIGVDWLKDINLTNKLTDNWRDFNKKFIPFLIEKDPSKTKVAAGLACGMLWTVAKAILVGDIVLCPDGKGSYYLGEVIGDYEYHKGEILPHRRKVRWFSKLISKDEISEALRHSVGSIGTVSNITKHVQEIESLIAGSKPQIIVSTDKDVEEPSLFTLEEHLEDFLVKNWKNTQLGKNFDIFEENGELVGQQYPTDTGPIDILAISKDKKTLLVVELKKGRASDVVVGQCQRYMGYVKEELAEKNQEVKGVIIAFEDDIKIRRALSVTNSISFYTYKVFFKLEKKI
jgi:restriction system protein